MKRLIMREPTHPGVFLQEDYMEPLCMNSFALSLVIGIEPLEINEICEKKRKITPSIAQKLVNVLIRI